MTIIDQPVALPIPGFVYLWRTIAGLGALHPVVGTDHHLVLSDDDRARLTATVWHLLTTQGQARNTTVSPLLRATLDIVAHADREFYAWLTFADGDHGAALVAARDRHAIRVIISQNIVAIEPLDTDRWLPDDLVSVLPEVPGAAITATSVSADLYENPTYRDPRKPLAEPPDTTPAETIKRLMTASRDAVYQLYTATRRNGDRIRSTPLTALDLTDCGRILTYSNHDDDGHQYIHVVPGTAHNLITTLETTNHGL